jgi:DNA modification methylase
MCGDATKKADVGRLLGPERANMVFTDPPYNVNYGANKIPGHKSRKILNDHLSNDEWAAFNKAVIENIKDYYSGGDLYVWGASGPDGMRQRLLLIDMGFHWSATIIWKKQQLVLSPAKYQRMYEPCFYGWLDKSTFQADRKQTEVWSFDRPLDSKLHPTMKPIAVCAYGIGNSSKKGDIVLDLFGGSGSTLMGCEQLDRRCFMMELDPVYCDVICKRWKDFTGKEPILEQREG